jgi:phosphoserine aminotransferase
MSKRAMNFFPGPAALPLSALERAQRELVDFEETGMSIMEHSHRGKAYEAVHFEAMKLLRSLMGIGDEFHVLFLGGGARLQFAMIPMNLLVPGKRAYYAITGTWAKGAYEEGVLVGDSAIAATTEENGVFTRVPRPGEFKVDASRAAYVHVTSNNTLFGTQYPSYPQIDGVPLAVDMTSDILCRPVDMKGIGLIYAAAQKNLGPAGVTVVIVRKDLVENARKDIPIALRYSTYAESDSLWNTPPAFPIYMMRNTLLALQEMGGAEAVGKLNAQKAQLLYEVIDGAEGFYRCPVEKGSRSTMNVVFRLSSEALEKKFLAEAEKKGMVGLKGHRSVGGLRASIYNFVELGWVQALAEHMREFAKANR